MRDVVRWHEARLPYDAGAVLADPANPLRRRMLAEAADGEGRLVLARAYRGYRDAGPDALLDRLAGGHANARPLAIAFYAWKLGTPPGELAHFLEAHRVRLAPRDIDRLARVYGNPSFGLLDYAYLLRRPALDVWCAGELYAHPGESWSALLARGGPA